MKFITTKVNCRGCQNQEIIECAEPGIIIPTVTIFKCKKCGSKCAANISRSITRRKIMVKVNMIEHTKTLLNILNRRQKNA